MRVPPICQSNKKVTNNKPNGTEAKTERTRYICYATRTICLRQHFIVVDFLHNGPSHGNRLLERHLVKTTYKLHILETNKKFTLRILTFNSSSRIYIIELIGSHQFIELWH